MSSNEVILNNGSQAIINYSTDKLLLRDNKFIDATYTNSTGSDVVITVGQLFGRIAATGLIVPLTSAATDGSQYPLGLAMKNVTVPDTESISLRLVVGGEVAKELISFDGTDDFDTDVEDKTLGDRIMSDTLGLLPVAGTELTGTDNQ